MDILAFEDNRLRLVAEGEGVHFDYKLVGAHYIDYLVEAPLLPVVVGQKGHQPALVNMAVQVGFQDFVLEEVVAEIFKKCTFLQIF